jgi:hypothetical protein
VQRPDRLANDLGLHGFTCASATCGVTPGARRPTAIQLKLSAADWRSSSVKAAGL